ncbi:MAG: hypothetical protein AAFX03_03630 [Pseudomonadota bacterium]
MVFTLPAKPNVSAMIDVRDGGEAAADAMMGIGARSGSGDRLGYQVYRGLIDDKVLTYAQWSDREPAQAWLAAHGNELNTIGRPGMWTARIYKVSSSANRGEIDLNTDDAVIAHTGLFAMRDKSDQAEMLRRGAEAAEVAVKETPELLTANFHGSLDQQRVVNLGFWTSEAAFKQFVKDTPFPSNYWSDIADNEPGLYRRLD